MSRSEFQQEVEKLANKKLKSFAPMLYKRMKAGSALRHAMYFYSSNYLIRARPQSQLIQSAHSALGGLDSGNPAKYCVFLETVYECYAKHLSEVSDIDVLSQFIVLQSIFNKNLISQDTIDPLLDEFYGLLDDGQELSNESAVLNMFSNATVFSGLKFY